MVGFKYLKDGASNVAIQLQYSLDGGINWVIATEANNNGTAFGVNTDGIPNIIETTAINTTNTNGLIYRSGQGSMKLVNGDATTTNQSPNILQKAKGKFECFVLGDSGSSTPLRVGATSSMFVLAGKKISVDYGGGVSFDIDLINHAGGVAFDFDVAGSNQQGVAGAGQASATQFNNRALKMNLAKNAMGLVWDLHENKANGSSAVIGELKLNRRATGGGSRGRFDLLNLTTGSFNGEAEILSNVVDSLVVSAGSGLLILSNSGIYNQANRQILSGGSPLVSGHFVEHVFDNEETDSLDVVEAKVGADASLSFAMLLNRITQNDMAITGIGTSPLIVNPNTRSGTIGTLIGFSQNVVFNTTAATTTTYTGDADPLTTSKDTTLHISIPELSNVKSFEGESSQIYKTIKVLPKADFDADVNSGSLNYSAPYEDYIDINNGTELQLSELTIQVRQPDGTLATTLKPITRTTIKIRENPHNKEMVRMEKMLELMERKASQNQQYIADTSKPDKVYT